MNDHALAAIFVLLCWWMSTAAILWIDGLPRWTFRFSLAGASVLAAAGLFGLWRSSQLESRQAAYLGFASALAVWAWHELSFLLGMVTGPRKEPCPPTARGWRRFAYATEAILHHEVALAITLVAILALTWRQPNQVGTGTFLVLWLMRLSAKLNVFLGVRNLATEFIPAHLRYLVSYFRKARLNPLMPVSIVVATLALARIVSHAFALEATPFTLVGNTLLATILGLAVIEHLFLTLPVPDAVLWRWAMRAAEQPPLAQPANDPRGEAP